MEQGRVWVDSASRVLPLRSLSDAHLENVITMLRSRAVVLLLDYALAAGLGRFSPRLEVPLRKGDADSVALEWLTSTPLWLALHREAARRAGRSGPQSLGATARGAWVVRTDGPTVVVDLDGRRVMAVLANESDPARGTVWRHVVVKLPVRIGCPLVVEPVPGGVGEGDGVNARRVVSLHEVPAAVATSDQAIAEHARTVTRLSSGRSPDAIATEFRTRQFIEAATDVRAVWAALDVLMHRHGVEQAALVPSRLRDCSATVNDVDLFVQSRADVDLPALQREVDDVLGYRVAITTPRSYGGHAIDDVADHALPLAPGS
ncbi:hypothetical protein ICW40_05675 [Actinotalea ferrariae]|uniref:hypothetical protein n=1 Tax=Actinotalea ferrariae TaxID=1386098 RepID=UPI001C8C8D52|nr:hypothetical protein [Actinotalea ferrariae]MBX9244295.1 hypothetical protein [Actinotalea ferrariae]